MNPSGYPMIIYTYLIADNLPIKTLVARQGVVTTICPVLPSVTAILWTFWSRTLCMNGKLMGVADHIHLHTHPFTTTNQAIKMPEKVDQAIKQASRDESNDLIFILTVKFLDRRRRWKYRAHGSDYPLLGNYKYTHICTHAHIHTHTHTHIHTHTYTHTPMEELK